jgi:hypothetical protein
MPEALPGVSASSPPSGSYGGGIRRGGLLRVVSNSQLETQEADERAQRMATLQARLPMQDLALFVRQRWTIFRNHRNQGNDPLNERLLRAQRMFEGQYDPTKLAAIRKFKGSEVYSRLVANKCRGATSLLRDVYLGAEKPWDIQPPDDPDVPPEIRANIMQLVSSEVQTQQQAGASVTPDQVQMRFMGLMYSAKAAAKRNAMTQAKMTADKIEELLVNGGFYTALAEFLTDLPLFPFACIKGPVVRMVPRMSWVNGQPKMVTKPQMFWERVSPFDVYWTPGVSRIEDAEIIQRKRLTRTDLNELLGLPGYDQAAVRGALDDYNNGLRDWLDAPDTEQALNEGRESPTMNQSNMIDAIEYHGNIYGKTLLENGVDKRLIQDPERDYAVQTWVVGRYTIKTQLNPSPRQRHQFYITSFEKLPGSVAGHALPDVLEDLQEINNATLRALVNNLSISSGPQVVVNDELLAPTENGDELYPWKRWHVLNDPMSNTREPITFFQPQSNAQQLLMTFQAITTMADEASAIPRYLTGESLNAGAGRTASGLSMLMTNAEKILQTVASNVDGDVMDPLLSGLYDMIMLTDDSGVLTGEEQIRVRGVNVATQKETQRQRQLQFLQITANPIDSQIIGVVGRARVLRAVSGNLGLPDDVVPDDQTLQQQMDAQRQVAAAQTHLGLPAGQQDPGAGNKAGSSSAGPGGGSGAGGPSSTAPASPLSGASQGGGAPGGGQASPPRMPSAGGGGPPALNLAS